MFAPTRRYYDARADMLLDARYGSHIDYMLLQNTQPPGLSKGNYSKPGGCTIMPAW